MKRAAFTLIGLILVAAAPEIKHSYSDMSDIDKTNSRIISAR